MKQLLIAILLSFGVICLVFSGAGKVLDEAIVAAYNKKTMICVDAVSY